MCGFIRRVTDSPEVQDMLDSIGLGHLCLAGGDFRQRAMLHGLIIRDDGDPRSLDAVWWYKLTREAGKLVPNPRVTSFNARDLSRDLWREPIRQRRGIVVADAIGESLDIEGQPKKQYLMESSNALILGALWNVYPTDDDPIYSTAVITRDPHDRFSTYHTKAFPLFLPPDPAFIRLWLDPTVQTHSDIDALLAEPRLFYDLRVTPVRTYKSGEALGETELLEAD